MMHRQVSVLDDGSHALGRLGQQMRLLRGGRARRRVVSHPQHQYRGPQRGTGGNGEHHGHAGELQQNRGQQRTDQRGHRVQQSADDVGAGQLVSGTAQRRQQRRMCRPIQGGGDGGERRQDVHDRCRATHTHDDRGDRGRHTSQRGHQDEDAFPAPPVGDGRQDGCQHCRWHHAHQSHQPDGRCATVAIGHDRQRHGKRPLSRPRPKKAQLRTSQVGLRALLANAPAAAASLFLTSCSATFATLRPRHPEDHQLAMARPPGPCDPEHVTQVP